MSESLDKVRGVKFLPLFPLPVVLLPNELMPLHIFEPRYRQMLKDIRVDKSFFGLSYFGTEESDLTVPKVGSIGCVAEVREAQTLEDGRSNILTVGVIRYVLEEYIKTDDPYLIGEVSFFEDEKESPETLKPLVTEVLELFTRMTDAAQELSGESRIRLPDISQAPAQEISFLIPAVLNFNVEMKYKLLETRSTADRLETIRLTLQQSVERLEENAEISKVAKTNGYSKKKINLE